MRKQKSPPAPIMTDDEQRFMVFEGLVQWTTAVISQAEQIELATSALNAANINIRLPAAKLRTQHHYFSLAAFKLLEHRNRAIEVGLCSNTNFQMLDSFSFCDIRDLRNMREHVLDYFKGEGRDKERWKIETPEYHADASAAAGTVIGGRLDWKVFAAAAEQLLPALLAEPIPYPPASQA
jgi:hypothetical protein